MRKHLRYAFITDDRRCAAAKINRIDCISYIIKACNDRFCVFIGKGLREFKRIKVAIGAFCDAKRYVNIHSPH